MASSSLLLPPPLWGSVLDYLPYKDVRTTFLISRTFKLDVIQHIETLNILYSSELHVPSVVEQFRNVNSVNVFCLMREVPLPTRIEVPLCNHTKENIVPFLQSFPLLRRVKIGSRHPRDGHYVPYSTTTFCREGAAMRHETQNFRDLVRRFIDAFHSRTLPLLESLDMIGTRPIGFFLWEDTEHDFVQKNVCEVVGGAHRLARMDPHPPSTIEQHQRRRPCRICKDICTYFPFIEVAALQTSCYTFWQRLDMIAERPGGLDMLRESRLIIFLLQGDPWSLYLKDLSNTTGLRSRIELEFVSKGMVPLSDQSELKYFYKERLQRVYKFQEKFFGCIDSKGLNKEEENKENLLRGLFKTCRYPVPIAIAQSTLDCLMSLGYGIHNGDFLAVIDDVSNDELRGITSKIYKRW